MVAIVRPDSWNLALLLHVLGAMLLVGTLILAASALFLSWRDRSPALVRVAYRALIFGVLPSWVLMRAGAEWIASKEGLEDSDLSWIGMGFTTSDGGIVAIVIAALLAGFALRRSGRVAGSGGGLARGAAILVALLVVAYLVTVWAMTTKPA